MFEDIHLFLSQINVVNMARNEKTSKAIASTFKKQKDI